MFNGNLRQQKSEIEENNIEQQINFTDQNLVINFLQKTHLHKLVVGCGERFVQTYNKTKRPEDALGAIIVKLDFTYAELVEHSLDLLHLVIEEPLQFEEAVKFCVFGIIRDFVKQKAAAAAETNSVNNDDADASACATGDDNNGAGAIGSGSGKTLTTIEISQLHIRIRFIGLPLQQNLQYEPSEHLFRTGLSVVYGILSAYTEPETLVLQSIWYCANDCMRNVIQRESTNAPNCTNCSRPMCEYQKLRISESYRLLKVLPVKSVETPKIRNKAFHALTVRILSMESQGALGGGAEGHGHNNSNKQKTNNSLNNMGTITNDELDRVLQIDNNRNNNNKGQKKRTNSASSSITSRNVGAKPLTNNFSWAQAVAYGNSTKNQPKSMVGKPPQQQQTKPHPSQQQQAKPQTPQTTKPAATAGQSPHKQQQQQQGKQEEKTGKSGQSGQSVGQKATNVRNDKPVLELNWKSYMPPSRDARDTRDTRDARDTRDSRDARDARSKNNNKNQTSKGGKVTKSSSSTVLSKPLSSYHLDDLDFPSVNETVTKAAAKKLQQQSDARMANANKCNEKTTPKGKVTNTNTNTPNDKPANKSAGTTTTATATTTTTSTTTTYNSGKSRVIPPLMSIWSPNPYADNSMTTSEKSSSCPSSVTKRSNDCSESAPKRSKSSNEKVSSPQSRKQRWRKAGTDVTFRQRGGFELTYSPETIPTKKARTEQNRELSGANQKRNALNQRIGDNNERRTEAAAAAGGGGSPNQRKIIPFVNATATAATSSSPPVFELAASPVNTLKETYAQCLANDAPRTQPKAVCNPRVNLNSSSKSNSMLTLEEQTPTKVTVANTSSTSNAKDDTNASANSSARANEGENDTKFDRKVVIGGVKLNNSNQRNESKSKRRKRRLAQRLQDKSNVENVVPPPKPKPKPKPKKPTPNGEDFLEFPPLPSQSRSNILDMDSVLAGAVGGVSDEFCEAADVSFMQDFLESDTPTFDNTAVIANSTATNVDDVLSGSIVFCGDNSETISVEIDTTNNNTTAPELSIEVNKAAEEEPSTSANNIKTVENKETSTENIAASTAHANEVVETQVETNVCSDQALVVVATASSESKCDEAVQTEKISVEQQNVVKVEAAESNVKEVSKEKEKSDAANVVPIPEAKPTVIEEKKPPTQQTTVPTAPPPVVHNTPEVRYYEGAGPGGSGSGAYAPSNSYSNYQNNNNRMYYGQRQNYSDQYQYQRKPPRRNHRRYYRPEEQMPTSSADSLPAYNQPNVIYMQQPPSHSQMQYNPQAGSTIPPNNGVQYEYHPYCAQPQPAQYQQQHPQQHPQQHLQQQHLQQQHPLQHQQQQQTNYQYVIGGTNEASVNNEMPPTTTYVNGQMYTLAPPPPAPTAVLTPQPMESVPVTQAAPPHAQQYQYVPLLMQGAPQQNVYTQPSHQTGVVYAQQTPQGTVYTQQPPQGAVYAQQTPQGTVYTQQPPQGTVYAQQPSQPVILSPGTQVMPVHMGSQQHAVPMTLTTPTPVVPVQMMAMTPSPELSSTMPSTINVPSTNPNVMHSPAPMYETVVPQTPILMQQQTPMYDANSMQPTAGTPVYYVQNPYNSPTPMYQEFQPTQQHQQQAQAQGQAMYTPTTPTSSLNNEQGTQATVNESAATMQQQSSNNNNNNNNHHQPTNTAAGGSVPNARRTESTKRTKTVHREHQAGARGQQVAMLNSENDVGILQLKTRQRANMCTRKNVRLSPQEKAFIERIAPTFKDGLIHSIFYPNKVKKSLADVELLPPKIKKLYNVITTKHSEYSFVYALSSQLCQERVPMDSYVYFKMSLLLSLASFEPDDARPPISLLVICYDTYMANYLLNTVGQLARRFVGPSDRVRPPVHVNTAKYTWNEASPVMLAKGGVNYVGDWKRLKNENAEKILHHVENSTVTSESGAANIEYPLETAIWSHWHPEDGPEKETFQKFFKVFGLPIYMEDDIDEVIMNYILHQYSVKVFESTYDHLSISSQDMREFIDLISKRKIEMSSVATNLLQEYYVVTREKRPDVLTKQTYAMLKQFAESFAKLSLHCEVCEMDVVAAIFLCENFIQNIYGRTELPAPKFMAFNYIGKIDLYMTVFYRWLQLYLRGDSALDEFNFTNDAANQEEQGSEDSNENSQEQEDSDEDTVTDVDSDMTPRATI